MSTFHKIKHDKSQELIEIQGTAIEDMWMRELVELKKYLEVPTTIKLKIKKK